MGFESFPFKNDSHAHLCVVEHNQISAFIILVRLRGEGLPNPIIN